MKMAAIQNSLKISILIMMILHLQNTDAQQSCNLSASLISYMASELQITYTVLDNPVTDALGVNVSVVFKNAGDTDIPAGAAPAWSIYIPSIRMIEPHKIRPNGVELTDVGLMVKHINGDLHEMTPLPSFPGIARGGSIDIRFTASDWAVSKTDVQPNWYITAEGSSPQIIASTAGESLSFVTDFTKPEQWKRLPIDVFDPYTPEVRYEKEFVPVVPSAGLKIIPTPQVITIDWTRRVNVLTHGWVIVEDPKFSNEIKYLAEKTGLPTVSDNPCNRFIHFIQSESPDESYNLNVNQDTQQIIITANTSAGVFYGIQTLLSLIDSPDYPGEVGHGAVQDSPRFEHRGMHLDVGRNFHTVSDVKRLLEVMSLYKMNRLHFHLTDDEGWRLEIPELPELTDVGSKRCHDLTERSCLIPLLGSGPTESSSGTGFFSVEEYRDILRFAAARHIKVIPEFDMPGHSHAAIKSMEARYHNYAAENITKAEEFLLRDLNDPSDYISIQYYTDNAINPCRNSTYDFIDVLIKSVKSMHEDIQPLEVIHLGGDEAPPNAYNKSESCIKLNNSHLKTYFISRISALANASGVDIALWEDGLYEPHDHIMDRTQFTSRNIYSNLWSNVWEWGNGGRAYEMANNNYKVILSHATHLYLDFPSEPDPLERGYYWATRFIPAKKTFSYVPDNVYRNIDLDTNRFGNPLTQADICVTPQACPALNEASRPNVIGIQGQLWSEVTRTSDQLDSMIMPRILSVAERAWHKAFWEDETNVELLKDDLHEDWIQFANTIGHKELMRLDKLQVKYEVPVAGARVDTETGALSWTATFPGLPARYSFTPETGPWTDLTGEAVITHGRRLHIKICSADGSRCSRVVSPEPGGPVSSATRVTDTLLFIVVSILPFFF